MSKKLKCPSCDMAGDPEGDDFSQVTTYHGRPVLQCFWCDSHVMLRRMGGPIALDLNHKAIRHLRSDLDHDRMVSLLLDNDEDLTPVAQESMETPAAEAELLVAAVETETSLASEQFDQLDQLIAAVEAEAEAGAPARPPKRRRARRPAAKPAVEAVDFEPAMLAEEPPVDNTPVLLHPELHNTPIGTGAELVSSIPVTAKALDHDSLIHIAAQIGWTYTPVRKQPEWMNFELPAPVELSPFRTKVQSTINMIKYFRINAGTKEQRRAETFARRQRLVEYRRRMFSDRIEGLSAIKAIEYKPEAV